MQYAECWSFWMWFPCSSNLLRVLRKESSQIGLIQMSHITTATDYGHVEEVAIMFQLMLIYLLYTRLILDANESASLPVDIFHPPEVGGTVTLNPHVLVVRLFYYQRSAQGYGYHVPCASRQSCAYQLPVS